MAITLPTFFRMMGGPLSQCSKRFVVRHGDMSRCQHQTIQHGLFANQSQGRQAKAN